MVNQETIFTYPTRICCPLWGWSIWNFTKIFGIKKLMSTGHCGGRLHRKKGPINQPQHWMEKSVTLWYTKLPYTVSNINTNGQATHQCDVTGCSSGAHVKTRLTDGTCSVQCSRECANSSVKTINHSINQSIRQFQRHGPATFQHCSLYDSSPCQSP